MSPTTAPPAGSSRTLPVYAYFGPVTLIVYLVMPHGYLLDIATSYMLKNQLRANADEVAMFRLLTALPIYFSFLFGLVRDLWSPFGLKDRGFFLLFAPVSAVVFIWLAYSPVSYGTLFTGMLFVMFSFRFVTAAYQGLITLIGQEQLMSGRLSTLWQVFQSLPYIAGALASGYIAEHLPPRQTFLLMAALSVLIALLGLWKPRAVFGHAYDRPQARGAGLVADLKTLVRHRPVYPAVLMMFLFQFAPGSTTPLQYYLTNELHASDAVFGYWYGIFLGSLLVMYFVYGYLCRRVSLEKLLWWGTLITVPQFIPLLFVHSANAALIAAVPIGLMGGLAAIGIYDLSMRSCPPGLQGTLMMLIDGAFQFSYRSGDVLGSWIYGAGATHGFLYCVIVTTAVYALLPALILLVPKDLMATADGQASVSAEAG